MRQRNSGKKFRSLDFALSISRLAKSAPHRQWRQAPGSDPVDASGIVTGMVLQRRPTGLYDRKHSLCHVCFQGRWELHDLRRALRAVPAILADV